MRKVYPPPAGSLRGATNLAASTTEQLGVARARRRLGRGLRRRGRLQTEQLLDQGLLLLLQLRDLQRVIRSGGLELVLDAPQLGDDLLLRLRRRRGRGGTA